MRLLSFLIVFVFALSNGSCQSASLVFGKGGGFSGEVTQFMITKKGKVHKGTGLAQIDYAQEGKMKRSEARKLFEAVEKLPDSSFHHPGNMYYFIEQTCENDTIRYTWGDPDFEAPEPVRTFYKSSMSRLSDIAFKSVAKTSEK